MSGMSTVVTLELIDAYLLNIGRAFIENAKAFPWIPKIYFTGRKKMRALCTGISGTSKGHFLIAFQSYAALQGKQVEILDMGEEMIKQATVLLGGPPRAIVERKILDLPRSTLNELRANVLQRLLDRAENFSQNGIDSVLATHLSFRWTKTITPCINLKYIEACDPDFYFILKAERKRIRAALDAHPAWQFRDVTLDDISVWQD